MDEMRDSVSKMKKKIKDKLKGSGRKSDRTRVDVGGEGASSTGPLPQPDPHVVVGDGHNREDPGVGIEGRESSQRNLHLDIEVTVESGPSREGNDVDGKEPDPVDPPPSTPPIPHSNST